MHYLVQTLKDVEIKGAMKVAFEEILSPDALHFIAQLHRRFNQKRLELLKARKTRQERIDKGDLPNFLPETKHIREGNWQVASIPADLQDRRTEITGPVDRKMIINALNSGAKVFMADFEDSNAPTWENCVSGQLNLRDANLRNIDFVAANGKAYSLNEDVAVLKVRPRGWHLVEKHVLVDGEPVAASLFDFGLYFFHNAHALLARGSGPYFYLPKLESHLEARLWNDVFEAAQKMLDVPSGSIKVTVLIETVLAAFEMEEILYELRTHIDGLNAGRWDYIFSFIKKFKNHKDFLLPDRSLVTMGVPFMQAYAQLLVQVCHKRGAHAIGGMSAFIPSKDKEINKLAFEKVRKDKEVEASLGYDGTWVAHPLLVPVAMKEFDKVLGEKPHQKYVKQNTIDISAQRLLNMKIKDGAITEEGLRLNINVGLLYIESWLQGVGAAALYNLMEDAATAEISRAQVWQWLHHEDVKLDDGRPLTFELYDTLLMEEKEKITEVLGADRVATGKLQMAIALFDRLIRQNDFAEFLTLGAYEVLD
ncbi:malate synthase A [Fulvivirgaceae bacterium BMA10]|uniref:malate synthase n=1 Tax=Splendidivirga corallicola TaxID=3051826 RepID=A0ABT8KM32_9BACT|nr:malate synthase A [Fulvivirgaceae bacterium BMA10]